MRKVVFDIEVKDVPHGRDLDPRKLEISVLCTYDFETGAYECYLEKDLPRLWQVLEKTDILIGYNSNHFDIPLLNRYYHGDLSRIKSLDLLEEIKKSLGRRLRLDNVAGATLGSGKTAHGLDAIKWWKEGNIEKICEYCKADVEITKGIYEYALQNGILKYKDLGTIRDIPIDTSDWNKLQNNSMTCSLPF